ncbi:MAG TPA: VOC family protein [Gaiellaceae bacterium]|nr:VOC family protein [Gaiellaceae bacterium]
MHRILLRSFVIDVPSDVDERERDFWTSALAAHQRPAKVYPEYHVLENGATPNAVAVQDIGSSPARVHFDMESDDVEAEVSRLVGLGAELVERHEHWVVLRDPAGLLFCVTEGEGADFEAGAREVE